MANGATKDGLPGELFIHERLAPKHDIPNNIVSLLDSFDHQGPNGTHQCLVFELMGPGVSQMIDLSPDCQIGEHWERRMPLSWTKKILRDILLGLQRLHSLGIVHGDLSPGNILFTLPTISLESHPADELCQQPNEHDQLERKDGKTDIWAPKYLFEPKPLYEYVSLDQDPIVKLGDFGGGKKFYCIS